MSSTSQLFQPIQVGNMTLQHRVVLAPLTRMKANQDTSAPTTSLVKEYYSQRSRTPGSLLVSEGTLVAEHERVPHIPGIWSDAQIKAWKEVVDEVHANGSFIFLQIAALGRSSDPARTAGSSLKFQISPVDLTSELSVSAIHEYVEQFVQAAKNAVHRAGFDGVEIHGANGFFIESFLKDTTNRRTDEYGGTIEKRSKLPLEVVAAVVNAVGARKTGIRLSPWSALTDPIPQYSHFVSQLTALYPDLAYLHLVEPRIAGDSDREIKSTESNDFLRAIWAPRPLISAGGHTRESALKATEAEGALVAFGRWYIANPDLPRRLKEDIPFTAYDRKTFYVPASHQNTEVGYTDYPFAPAAALLRPVQIAASQNTLVEPVQA